LQSLFKATKSAIGYAITNVQANLTYTITENYDYNGTYDPGSFYIVFDDGTGSPSSTLINAVASAIDAVRALGIRFAVFPPSVVAAVVTATIVSAAGYTHSIVASNVSIAIQAFINSLPLGQTLPYTQLPAIAYGVPGVINVSNVILDSATSDLTATSQQIIKCPALPVIS